MSNNKKKTLTIGLSSRALFDLSESHQIFVEQGIDAYQAYQIAHEEVILEPGPAFHFAKKLLAIKNQAGEELVEVVLLSRNSADSGLRIFNSIAHHQLPISRAVFTGGSPPYRYVDAFAAALYLSANGDDVRKALDEGIPAANIVSTGESNNRSPECRIAFDGDAVIFSDEAERIYQEYDIQAFHQSESDARLIPLADGPFKPFLEALHCVQSQFPADNSPIRTALVTSRSAPAHERVIRTFRAWGIRIDEALFLGGLSKAEFLQSFGADVFFDDQMIHCETAKAHVACGHVPAGIINTNLQ